MVRQPVARSIVEVDAVVDKEIAAWLMIQWRDHCYTVLGNRSAVRRQGGASMISEVTARSGGDLGHSCHRDRSRTKSLDDSSLRLSRPLPVPVRLLQSPIHISMFDLYPRYTCTAHLLNTSYTSSHHTLCFSQHRFPMSSFADNERDPTDDDRPNDPAEDSPIPCRII
jgi:hypothetical protein